MGLRSREAIPRRYQTSILSSSSFSKSESNFIASYNIIRGYKKEFNDHIYIPSIHFLILITSVNVELNLPHSINSFDALKQNSGVGIPYKMWYKEWIEK
jgi:hypothetical protein